MRKVILFDKKFTLIVKKNISKRTWIKVFDNKVF